MRIASICIKDEIDGLSPFLMDGLGRFVVLAGENGSGKTRLLKMIEKAVKPQKDIQYEKTESLDITFVDDEGRLVTDLSSLSLVNYSHSDLPLRSAKDFPPYVIRRSKDNLEKESSNFEQTAYDTMLYLTYLVRYSNTTKNPYSQELETFNRNFCEPLLGGSLELDEDTKEPKLLGHALSDLTKEPLSPGQKYLLRLCVALNCNIIPEGSILFIDEPESHLHPKVLLEFFDKLRDKFELGQIWIATHSIELVSSRDHSDIWYMSNGTASKMGSKTEKILKGILGEEKRYALYQFVSSPDAFACNTFAVECLCNPEVFQKATVSDTSTGIIKALIQEGDIIVDFGAGKGRFLESYFMQEYPPKIEYYAYDKHGYSAVDGQICSAYYCKKVMERHSFSIDNYFGDEESFEGLAKIANADKALLINVLHEIAPSQWVDVFGKIDRVLNENGVLLIVEREELTIGEQPFDSDFFVLQSECLSKLFSCSLNDVEVLRHKERSKVVGYIIPKRLLANVTDGTIKAAMFALKDIAAKEIREVKKDEVGTLSERGLSLAFWTHQFANASLFLMT